MSMVMYGSLCSGGILSSCLVFLGVMGSNVPHFFSNATNAYVGASANVMHVDAHGDDLSNTK